MLVSVDKKWEYALGMLKIDGLKPSEDFIKMIEKEKKGEITTTDMFRELDIKYKRF